MDQNPIDKLENIDNLSSLNYAYIDTRYIKSISTNNSVFRMQEF